MESLNKITLICFAVISILLIHACKGCSKSGRKSQATNNGNVYNSQSQGLISQQEGIKSDHFTCGLIRGNFYNIKKLVDGDTFWLEDGCEGVKIRLIGIDAPEPRDMFGTIKEEPYGKEASAFMEQLVSGRMIRVEFDVDSLDQYGRTLAYCFTEDGIFINQKMIEEGMAMIMTVVPNVKYQDLFYKTQVNARMNGKGLWNR